MPYSPSGSSFPASKTSFTDPTALSGVDTFDHAGLESAQNDAIEKLEDVVGTTNSADTASLSYKVGNTSSVDPGHKHTTASISGQIAVAQGGTGLSALGQASQVLVVNDAGTALEYKDQAEMISEELMIAYAVAL